MGTNEGRTFTGQAGWRSTGRWRGCSLERCPTTASFRPSRPEDKLGVTPFGGSVRPGTPAMETPVGAVGDSSCAPEPPQVFGHDRKPGGGTRFFSGARQTGGGGPRAFRESGRRGQQRGFLGGVDPRGRRPGRDCCAFQVAARGGWVPIPSGSPLHCIPFCHRGPIPGRGPRGAVDARAPDHGSLFGWQKALTPASRLGPGFIGGRNMI